MNIQMKDIQLRMPKLRKAVGRYSKTEMITINNELREFAEDLKALGSALGKKVSARGWCYLLENLGKITKNEFDLGENYINKCRYEGLIPVDFIEVDQARAFSHLERIKEDTKPPEEYIIDQLESLKDCHRWKKDVGFWESQKVYIQMMVEKKDVFNLFYDICDRYHIPIANAKGWSDINSRFELAMRFKEADAIGLKPVLLYFGDHDPAGLMISDTMIKNISDLSKATNWDASKMVIDRFGLNYDFIQKHNLLWIENLITGSGKPADKSKSFIKDYIGKYGERKCEANAVLVIEKEALSLCEQTILKYFGADPLKDWNEKVKRTQDAVVTVMNGLKIHDQIDAWIAALTKPVQPAPQPAPQGQILAVKKDDITRSSKQDRKEPPDDNDDPGIIFGTDDDDDPDPFNFDDQES